MRARILSAVLVVLASTIICTPASGDDLPAFRKGLWKFQRTVGKQTIDSTDCVSPTEHMKKQNAMLEKAGCRFSPATKSGNTYTFTAACSMKDGSGTTLTSQTKSAMTVESDAAYTVEVDVTSGGKTSKEKLVARRLGDCKP